MSRVRCVGGLLLWLGTSLFSWVTLGSAIALRFDFDLPEVTLEIRSGERGAEPEPSILSIPDRLGKGETLSTVLGRNGFSAAEVHEIARALSAILDVRHLRAGDEIEVRYEGGDPESIWVQRGPLHRVHLVASEAGWQSESTKVELERRTVAIGGVLEDNLFSSMSRLGEKALLTIAFANVLAWDIDFHSQSRRGDRFDLVVEKLYRGGEHVGYGDLRAVRYVSRLSGERVFSAFLFEDPSGRRDYYDMNGKSMRKAFLRAPVDFERISSGFSYSRLHPIHKRRMPHLGVDYAAKTGTPVYSVASGVVTDRGVRGGGGNQVTIKHQMGYVTKYLHLSRFAKGLSVGQRVEQKEVIGYVGSTGAATGPHLDFRLYRHGKPVNPLTQIFPPGPPVADEHRGDFDLLKSTLLRQLDLAAESPATVVAILTDD